VRWRLLEKGGHFAAVEVPVLFVAELRQYAAHLANGAI
jgi:hypothetical protein